ncbi:hypothetical protein D1O30_02950 [Methylocystis hirsuta]|uniref:Uncharacterized protein n=1 Tax=Methylocystis hirsuta TaxID=369798 RepID=A0A3M9XM12_9HYPH|nr:hypothetical protein D1O30_02950 [Methylocystis hirsuta]
MPQPRKKWLQRFHDRRCVGCNRGLKMRRALVVGHTQIVVSSIDTSSPPKNSIVALPFAEVRKESMPSINLASASPPGCVLDRHPYLSATHSCAFLFRAGD